MAANRKARARRRIADRTKRNALALATRAELATEPTKRKYTRHKTPLEAMEARGSITLTHRRAGERLAKDYRISGSTIGRLVGRYEPWAARTTGARDTPAMVDARARFEAALQALGMWLSPIVVHTVLCDEPATEWGPLNGRAVTDGPAVLRVALDALAAHYREQQREAA